MENQIPQKPYYNTLIIMLITFFERMSYYGVRSMLVFYMISETFQLSDSTAISAYGYILYFLILTQLIGGVVGDFLFNHKITIFIGGLLAVLGCVTVCIPNTYALYSGLIVMTLGSGLCKPNIMAIYGKTYYKDPQYLDTVFTYYYLLVNIGAFIGIALFTVVSSKFGFVVGFGIAAILYIVVSLLSLAISKTKEELVYDRQKLPNNSELYVAIVLFLSAVFWGLYELGGIRRVVLLSNDNFANQLGTYFSKRMLDNLDFTVIVPLLIVFGIIWLKFHRSQFLKITFGFLCMAIAFLLLMQISLDNLEGSYFYLIIGILFFVLAEVFMGPIILSVVSRYTNPKYLGLVMASYAVVSLSVIYMMRPVDDVIYDKSEFFISVGLVVATSITILLFLGVIFGRNILEINSKKQKYYKSSVK